MEAAQHLFSLVIPHHTNNHKPRLLHNIALVLILALLIVYQMILLILPKTEVDILGYASQISVEEVVTLTNKKRAEAGLSTLSMNPDLAQAAKAKGEHMLANDYWAHIAPDGTEPWKFFSDVGYKYRYAGENLARDFSNAGSAVDAWMASITHKENMLSPRYTEIGVAVVEGDMNGVDTTIIVQLFGTQLNAAVAQVPESESIPTATLTPETPIPVETQLPTQVPVAIVHATSTPTPLNTPTVQPVFVSSLDDAGVAGVSQSEVLISPFTTSRGVSLSILGLLLVVLMLDMYIMRARKLARIGGRTYAHISFLGILFIVAMILRAGKIL